MQRKGMWQDHMRRHPAAVIKAGRAIRLMVYVQRVCPWWSRECLLLDKGPGLWRIGTCVKVGQGPGIRTGSRGGTM